MDDSYQLEMEIQSDKNGFFDRECPNEECQFTFKINLRDWEEKVSDEHVFCPRCGFDAPSNQWWTQDQLESIRENMGSFALGLVYDDLGKAFRTIERKTRRNKYARITFELGRRPAYADVPIVQTDEWATEIVCVRCGTRFSVIGNAYFCPCCRKDLTTNVIRDSLESYRRRINGFDKLMDIFEQDYSIEEAAKQIDDFRKDTLNSLVGTFEAFAKNRFLELGGTPQNGNVFQRVIDGSNLFVGLIGKGYEDFAGKSNIQHMVVMFNRRHLLTHNNGMVDNRYLKKTGDSSYSVGQRIVLKDVDLVALLNTISDIVDGLLAIVPS